MSLGLSVRRPFLLAGSSFKIPADHPPNYPCLEFRFQSLPRRRNHNLCKTVRATDRETSAECLTDGRSGLD